MPSEIAGANKCSILRDIAPAARMERYASDFTWLVDARVTLPCYNVYAPQAPLVLNEQHDLIKLYPPDVGLLVAIIKQPIQFELLQGDAGINNGAILETFAAQQLVTNGYDLRYLGKSTYGEIDFVLPHGLSTLAVEIKPGESYRRHKTSIRLWKLGMGHQRSAGVLPRQRSDRWVYLLLAVVYDHVLQAHEGWAHARRLQDQADA